MSQDLATQEKKELVRKGEQTAPARYFVPATDIYETADALILVMETPGVEKKDIDVKLEDDVLRIEGKIDFSKYEGLRPVYAEYNVGHYLRSFALPDRIDHDGISAELSEGVLTLTLKKAKEALPRRIPIG
jgi:HSP20 family molecular chaperone IbpA